jgi:hypothetical protein
MERAEALAARGATGVPMKAEADPKVRARTMAENCMIEMSLRGGREEAGGGEQGRRTSRRWVEERSSMGG